MSPPYAGRWGHRFVLRFDLSHDEKKKRWSGTGVLQATGVLSPFDAMTGLDDQARRRLQQFAAAVLGGAEVKGFNPERFEPSRVVLGFKLHVPRGERDDLGRFRLEVGEPGVLDPMLEHAAVHLHESERGSAVVLPAASSVRIELSLDPGDLETSRLPESVSISNEAGRLEVTAEQDDDGITVSLSLDLFRARYEAADWNDLRALLLAGRSAAGRTILLE
jgi:hypothetical protein